MWKKHSITVQHFSIKCSLYIDLKIIITYLKYSFCCTIKITFYMEAFNYTNEKCLSFEPSTPIFTEVYLCWLWKSHSQSCKSSMTNSRYQRMISHKTGMVRCKILNLIFLFIWHYLLKVAWNSISQIIKWV